MRRASRQGRRWLQRDLDGDAEVLDNTPRARARRVRFGCVLGCVLGYPDGDGYAARLVEKSTDVVYDPLTGLACRWAWRRSPRDPSERPLKVRLKEIITM